MHQRKLRHLLLAMVMKSIKSNTDCVPAIPPGKTSKANINKYTVVVTFALLQCYILVTNAPIVFYINFDHLTHIQHL